MSEEKDYSAIMNMLKTAMANSEIHLSPAQFALCLIEATGMEYAQMVQVQLVMKLIEK